MSHEAGLAKCRELARTTELQFVNGELAAVIAAKDRIGGVCGRPRQGQQGDETVEEDRQRGVPDVRTTFSHSTQARSCKASLRWRRTDRYGGLPPTSEGVPHRDHTHVGSGDERVDPGYHHGADDGLAAAGLLPRCRCRDIFSLPNERAAVERALELCCRCPVLTSCQQYAISRRERYGIWGGLTEEAREGIMRRS